MPDFSGGWHRPRKSGKNIQQAAFWWKHCLYCTLCLDMTLKACSSSTGSLKITIIFISTVTWAGERAGLLQCDLLVSVDGQLQAAAQLLVHQAFSFSAAIRHKAGQVPVPHAVSAHHTLTAQEKPQKKRKKNKEGELSQWKRGDSWACSLGFRAVTAKY